MRIAINTRFLLPGKLEGMGRFIQEVCRHWVLTHPEHEFIFLFDRPYSAEFIFEPRIEARVVYPPARHPLLWYAWYEWAIPRALRACRADVFLSPDNFLALATPVPTLLVVHDIAYAHFPEQVPWWPRRYYQHYMPRYVERAERIAVVSDYTKRDLVETLGADADKIGVVWGGGSAQLKPLDEATKLAARQRYSPGGQPYWLYVGSVHPRKNLPRLLRAYEQLCEQSDCPYPLLLAGRMAWQTGEVYETLQAMKHRERVHFLGYVPENELAQLLGGAFASVYVSLFEGFGLPVLEGFQAGLPVITSNCSSMPEVAGEAALLADPYSVDSIAQAMLRLYREPGLAAQLAQAGLARSQAFSWTKTAKAMWTEMQVLLQP